MRGLRSGVLGAVLLAILATTPAVAQLRFSLGGGVTLPAGTLADQANTGWHGMGAIGFQPASFPIGIQVDVLYNRFGFQESGIDADWQLVGGTVNAVFRFGGSKDKKRHLYLIGGVGGYNVKAVGNDAGGINSNTDFAVDIGGGFDFALGGLSTFIEGRYHAIFNGIVDPNTLEDATASFVPITLGIRF